MNNKLQFSWGHIIALLAAIVLCYAVFVGISFESGGDFLMAGLVVAFIFVMVLVFFMGAQQLKGWHGDFRKLIWWERAFVCFFAPLSLVFAAWPVANFLGIHQQREELVGQFACAIDTSKAMFADYEAYANDRLERYNQRIGYLYYNRSSARRNRMAASPLERENRQRALRLLLLSSDYENMRTDALEWIEGSQGSAAPLGVFLNVFLLSNIEEIESAIDGWNSQLAGLSARKLSDESASVEPFGAEHSSAVVAKALLDDLKQQYRQRHPVTLQVGLVMLVLWLMLMLPYALQRRHTKNTYRLFGSERRGKWVLDEKDDELPTHSFVLKNHKK